MIERYEDNKIKRIWSKNHRFFLWQKIELIYLNNILKNKNIIPNDTELYPLQQFDDYMFSQYEKQTKHEIVAFLKELSYRLDIYHEKYPEVNQYLHYGLTSSDIIDTAFSIQINESLDYLILLLIELKSSTTDKIRNIKPLPAIGRTHGKHAEPIDFSQRFELLNTELYHCIDKVLQAKKNLYGKLQGPVGTSSFVFKDAAKTTLEELNLKEVPFATQVIPRIYYTDTMYALVLLASCFERFATMIRLSCIDEINEMQEHFSPGQTGSSAMPHKNNPIISENICGLARYIKSNFQVALDNNNLWWERDISHSSNERLIWPESFHLICNLTLKLKKLIDNLHINSDQIHTNLSQSNSKSHQELLLHSTETTRFDAYEIVQRKYNSFS